MRARPPHFGGRYPTRYPEAQPEDQIITAISELSIDAQSYVLWLFVGFALVLPPYALWRDGRRVIPAAMQRFWLRSLIGGALQVLSYGIALWAMTLAPIAIVASLRETSVLFGTAIAVVALKEPLHAVRIVAAVLIVCGLVLLRL